MNSEIWKPVKDIEGAYVSNWGNVKSITTHGEKILKPQVYRRRKHNEPRLRVMIDRKRTQGKVFYPFLHTLVAEYFLPPSDSSKLIFRDGNPLYCGVFNLAWMHDFNTEADHNVLSKYSKFTTDFGKAVYLYCTGDDSQIQKHLARWSLSMPRIYSTRYGLSETEADEAYWLGATQFMQKVRIGYIKNEETIEGFLFTSGNLKAKYMKISKYKDISDTQCYDGDESYVMDRYVTSDLGGITHYH